MQPTIFLCCNNDLGNTSSLHQILGGGCEDDIAASDILRFPKSVPVFILRYESSHLSIGITYRFNCTVLGGIVVFVSVFFNISDDISGSTPPNDFIPSLNETPDLEGC